MSVVGFDIGNENCVVAVVKLGGIDVLLNDESQRETPAVVCFGEKQRFLGSAGAASAMMHPKSTVSQVKRLIGRKYKDPDVQDELKMLPVESCEGSNGGVLIRIKYAGETHTFSPIQIMAMLFAHLKDITEKNLEMPVSDCVIGIPSYFSDLQRHAYLNAATIAGLKPLRLMHDCTATALSYGIYKTDFPHSGLTFVAFVDIGHCDTQVCIAAFEAGHMRILSHAFDRDLGGRNFDEVLFSHFAAQFKEQYHIDVYSNVKACIRLRVACEKLKKVLSANAEAPLNIECLMDEKDVRGFIKREEFEKLASGLFERIQIPCKKALADAKLPVEKLHSVELVGSGSRIPAISKLIASIFRREPSRTLNASECVSRGCALQCAMLSPVFRVREYEVQDSVPFSVGISSDGGHTCTAANPVPFLKGQLMPTVKILKFNRSSSFHLETFYANPDELPPGISTQISSYEIGPFKSSNSGKAKVKVRVQLNLHGIVKVDSAMLLEDNVDDVVGNEDVRVSTDRIGMEHASASGVPPVENGVEDGTVPHRNPSTASTHHTRKDKLSRKHKIPVNEKVYGGLSETELMEALQKEIKLAQQDRIAEQTKEKKNALESYVYEMRSKLFNTYRSFANDEEREGISRSLQQTEDWLYEDGDDETENAYALKLEDLRKMVDPVDNRYKDEEARAQATKDILKCIVDYRARVDSLPPKDKEKILSACYKAEQWLRERTQLQESLPKSADPLLWSSEIRSKAEELDRTCGHILKSKTSCPGDTNDQENHNPSST